MRRNFFKFVKDSDAPDEVGVIAVALLTVFALLPWVEIEVGPVDLRKSSVPFFVSPLSFFVLIILFVPVLPEKEIENLADRELMFRIEYLRRLFEPDQVTVWSAMDAKGALDGSGSGFSAAVADYDNRYIEAVVKDARKYARYAKVINEFRLASRDIPTQANGREHLLDSSVTLRLKHILAEFPH